MVVKESIFRVYKAVCESTMNGMYVYKDAVSLLGEKNYSAIVEMYNDRAKKYGNKKLHKDQYEVEATAKFAKNVMMYIKNYYSSGLFKKENLKFVLFFIEDKLNKDMIPAIMILGSSPIMVIDFYRSGKNDKVYMEFLCTYNGQEKQADKLWRWLTR